MIHMYQSCDLIRCQILIKNKEIFTKILTLEFYDKLTYLLVLTLRALNDAVETVECIDLIATVTSQYSVDL